MIKNSGQQLFRFLRTKPIPENTNEILALERTKLANERTLLSYISASLYLLLGGLALLQLEEFQNIIWVGYAALITCVVFLVVGIFRFVLLNRKLHKWNRILYTVHIPEKPKNPVSEVKKDGSETE